MKKTMLSFLLLTGVIGSLFAQDSTTVNYDNETLLYGKKISNPIRFINKDANDVELTGLIALSKFNFEVILQNLSMRKSLQLENATFIHLNFTDPISRR